MKNFLVLVLVLVMVLAFSTSAYAARQVFNGVSVEVPTGWGVVVDKDGWGALVSPNGTESISFEYSSAEGMDSCQFAKNVADNLGGSAVVETNSGDFAFTFLNNGVNTNARAFMVLSVGVVMKTQSDFGKLNSILETCTW